MIWLVKEKIMPRMPKKLPNIQINSEKELIARYDNAFAQIQNADNEIEHEYLIKLTDAEKLILHLSLQQIHVFSGGPISIEQVMIKCIEMIKINIESKH
jgi:hypothetical protein